MHFLDDWSCKKYAICEAAQESSKLGPVGAVIAKVATRNASSWLTTKGEGGKGVTKAGNQGARGGDCAATYVCGDRPGHYQHPAAVIRKNQTETMVDTFLSLMNE